MIASFSSYSQSTSKIVVGLTRPQAELIMTDLYEREYLLKENARLDSLVSLLEFNIELYKLTVEDGIENEENYLKVISNLQQVITIHEFDLKQNKKQVNRLKFQNVLLKIGIGIAGAVIVKQTLFN